MTDPAPPAASDWGRLAEERLARIARCSAPGQGVTRLPFTSAHRDALAEITDWMTSAGMEVSLDAAGTLIGRRGPADAPTFYMGSHQDSVREGGAFDGIMGVALACLAVEKLTSEGIVLPFAIEVAAFADEEGVRFPTALIGPRALAGTFDPSVLDLKDREGISLREALTEFGCDPDAIPSLARDPARAMGYLELHIEQGPILEAERLPLGIVTAICGIERHTVTFTGRTGHAGTLPMEGRQDALVGAADFISFVHDFGRRSEDLRVTVGQIDIAPGVVNAVPREARLTLEIRAPDDGLRAAAGQRLADRAGEIADLRGLALDMRRTYVQPAQPCDPALRAALVAADIDHSGAGRELPSGATHDASAMADLCPIAMLFLRCRDGVSHVPEEHASATDMGRAISVAAAVLAAQTPN
ncbi:M20 family metallo-hydrolase [Maritimibacter sp. DP1N21-5]|uniref:M20 family metallo-hydrolase n=1 Tax=Maritimibacter sp. DP1N21-5 TaxID=2836867 RepID=UPI002105D191|nr:M20 family metallo-hydrolase [Maritimibacter sp. DP1N21-5]